MCICGCVCVLNHPSLKSSLGPWFLGLKPRNNRSLARYHMIFFIFFFSRLVKKILIPWVQSLSMSHVSWRTFSKPSLLLIHWVKPSHTVYLFGSLYQLVSAPSNHQGLFKPHSSHPMGGFPPCAASYPCARVWKSKFYCLTHRLQREFRLPGLCFSQVWIFSAPTIQLYTFPGLDISCGSGNIMTHRSASLRWIKLIKLPAFPSCLHQRKVLLL